MSRHTVDLRAAGSHEFLAAYPTCWLCHHHIPPGTGQIDHLVPVSVAPELAMVVANWRPAHGVAGCTTCPPTVSSDKRRHGQPRRCNQARGNRQHTPPSPRSRRW
jgi:hypothetical protein